MFRITKLLQSLLTIGNEKASERMSLVAEVSTKEITSIRLQPQTKAYLQTQSETLGISVSQFINIILDGVVAQETKSSTDNKVNMIYDRIMSIFESHHINPIDMTKMLSSHGITLSKVRSPELFTDAITIDMINDIAQWFSIDYKWLTGETNDIYKTRNIIWYKNIYGMCLEMIKRLYLHNDLKVYVVKNEGVTFEHAEACDNNEKRLDMGFIFSYSININGVNFTKYEVCEFQRWNYSRCREHLQAIFYFLDKMDRTSLSRRIRYYGISFHSKIIDTLRSGEVFPVNLEKEMIETWYPNEHIPNMVDVHEIKEKVKKTDHLIAILNDRHLNIDFTETIQNFSHGWNISYTENTERRTEFHHDLSPGLINIYNKCAPKPI